MSCSSSQNHNACGAATCNGCFFGKWAHKPKSQSQRATGETHQPQAHLWNPKYTTWPVCLHIAWPIYMYIALEEVSSTIR